MFFGGEYVPVLTQTTVGCVALDDDTPGDPGEGTGDTRSWFISFLY